MNYVTLFTLTAEDQVLVDLEEKVKLGDDESLIWLWHKLPVPDEEIEKIFTGGPVTVYEPWVYFSLN